jgi:hypothetical protein
MSRLNKNLIGMAMMFAMAEQAMEEELRKPEKPKREPEKLPEPIPHFANPKKLSKRERKKLKGKKK